MATLSGYGPHTAAKHRILRRYLEAWLPILSRAQGRGGNRGSALVLIDGFAGAGRYDTGEPGSPLVMLDAYLDHSYGDQIDQTVHFVFIEKEKGFVDHLKDELESKTTVNSRADVDIRHGLFAHEFPKVIDGFKAQHGRMPATFAFIDPFGLKDNTLELTSGLAVEQRCEVLAYLPTGFMARFKSTEEFAPALDNLYGDREAWIQAKEITDHEERRTWLRDRFGEVLSAQTRGMCLSFDIQPQGSTNIYSLIFASQNRIGIQRMKEAMWKVDPVSGQFFRGGRKAVQPENLFDLLDEPGDDVFATHVKNDEPDFELLEKLLRQRFGLDRFRIEDAADFTLFETVFRDDAHLKRPVLGKLHKRGNLRVIESTMGKSRVGAYPNGTILQFVN